jgi:phage terminase small subunit
MGRFAGEFLTPAQEAFCREYVRTHKAKASAISAGFSERTASVQAHQLLKLDRVQQRINQLEAAKRNAYRATRDEWIAEVSKIAFADVKDIVDSVDANGVKLKSLADIDGTLIASLSTKSNGMGGAFVDVKAHDKMKALELLGKHLGSLSPHDDDTEKPSANITINLMPATK